MSRSVSSPYESLLTILTPSQYSKQVNLWWLNLGVELNSGLKFLGFVYTNALSSPSNSDNCQK